ncbi:hypothetical protein [Natrialba asiatica]|uniref:Uncharacterized protein n=1 Tax=Natrialba asiatica (strain ATCC 700177 / DSM 12278 / JCM 9576 / FERM P-10747 / NBRC 102637 / 172P1) TaxID=29540 RepID=M0AWI5_NATA1|nr:hypothetical protein [Natrialba asiatica]ELZ02338.1 hypothetical protein C481_06696 [Natrialba asiatica DSM 12278]
MQLRPSDRPEDHRRRRLLRTVGAAVTTGTVISTAGCLASLPMLGQQIRYADVDVPNSGEPIYREWIPAASALDGSNDNWANVMYATPGEMGESVIGARYSMTDALLRAQMDYLGVGYENYERVVGTGPVIIGLGSFTAATVRETILESGYERLGSYEGYDCFERTDLTRGVAVRDGVIIFRRRKNDGGSLDVVDLETAIDAGAGRIERHYEADDRFERLTRAAGSRPELQVMRSKSLLNGDLVDKFDVRWSSMGYTFDEDRIYHQFVHVCGEEPSLSERRVKAVLEHDNRALDAYAVDVTIDDPILQIDMSESHAAARDRSSSDGVTYPQITWGVRTVADGEQIELSHDGGDAVDANRLTVTYGANFDTEPKPDRQFADEFETVESGASLTLDITDRPQEVSVTVGYRPRESSSLTVLFRVDPSFV